MSVLSYLVGELCPSVPPASSPWGSRSEGLGRGGELSSDSEKRILHTRASVRELCGGLGTSLRALLADSSFRSSLLCECVYNLLCESQVWINTSFHTGCQSVQVYFYNISNTQHTLTTVRINFCHMNRAERVIRVQRIHRGIKTKSSFVSAL